MQSLYAILGVILVSLFSLNQKSARINANKMMMRSEIELRATGLARQMLDDLATLPFDARSPVSAVGLLTPRSSFGLGSSTYHLAADLDDVHGKQISKSVVTDTDSLHFTIHVNVEYVAKQGDHYVVTAGPTYYKKVSMTFTGPLQASFALERVYSYQDF